MKNLNTNNITFDQNDQKLRKILLVLKKTKFGLKKCLLFNFFFAQINFGLLRTDDQN